MNNLKRLNSLNPAFKHVVVITTYKKGAVSSEVVKVEYLENLIDVNKYLNDLNKSGCFNHYDLKRLGDQKALRIGYDDNMILSLTLI